jgi:maleate cis-trans isomerase
MKGIRVGLMVPINNTTMDRELTAWLPEGSHCHTLKVPRGPGLLTRETVPAYVDGAIDLARQYAVSPPDLIAYGCTAAGFLMGPAADADLSERLQQVSGRPVVTTANAMVAVLQRTGAQRVAVVTPYKDEVNQQLTRYLEASGIEVERLNAIPVANTDELGRVTAEQVDDMARRTVTDRHEALFIACSQLPTLAILEGLRQDLGIPVWSSIAATATIATELMTTTTGG